MFIASVVVEAKKQRASIFERVFAELRVVIMGIAKHNPSENESCMQFLGQASGARKSMLPSHNPMWSCLHTRSFLTLPLKRSHAMWKRLPSHGSSTPSPRNCISMDTDGERAFVFGGLGSSSKERFNELWIYNPTGMLSSSHFSPFNSSKQRIARQQMS